SGLLPGSHGDGRARWRVGAIECARISAWPRMAYVTRWHDECKSRNSTTWSLNIMRSVTLLPPTLLVAGLLGACGAKSTAPISATGQDLDTENGLSINGLSINGLSINGLSINGLSINGLSTANFSNWFNQNLAQSPQLTSYLVKCAWPEGGQLT